jgi:hypothetical protein
VRRAQVRGRQSRQGGFGDIDELIEAKRPARPGRLSMRCSLRRGVGLRVGSLVTVASLMRQRGGRRTRRGHRGAAIRRHRTAPQRCGTGSSPVRGASTRRPAARSGLSAQGRAVGARRGYIWLARELLGSSCDTHSKNGRCEPVSAGPGDYLFKYLRSALLTSLPLGHPPRDLGPRSEAELGKNVRPIAIDLAKPSSSFSCVPLPNTVLGERFGTAAG